MPALAERGLMAEWEDLCPAEQQAHLSWLREALPAWQTARVWEIVNSVADGYPPPSMWHRRWTKIWQAWQSMIWPF